MEEERQRTLEQALEMAEQANMAKTELLSRVSHEIRTPMNAILGVTSIARENCDDKETLITCINKIAVSSKYLLALIDDILDMSQIEQGGLEIAHEKFAVKSLMHEIAAMTEVHARKKRIRYTCENRVKLEGECYGDIMRVQQILVNLITNAIHFTPKDGTVTFLADVGREEKDSAELVFRVTDSGIGMEQAFMEHMFEPFAQEDRGKSQGSGLGLTIVKSLTDAMGGRIAVESRVGHGTTFTVQIPFEKAEASENTVERETYAFKLPRRRQQLEGYRILMAEDHPLNIAVVSQLLERQGVLVTKAENGREALEQFSSSEPGYYDAILMDIRMPVMDGLEATKKIRALERMDAQTIPIIAMTAGALDEDRKRTKEAGMAAHLAKPFEKEQLYATVAEVLSSRVS